MVQKDPDQELFAAYGELEELVGQRTEELAQANEELHVYTQELLLQQEELRQQNEELLATRRQIEAERRRYEELFEFAPDGYLVLDAGGLIQQANRAAGALLRVSPDFLAGKPLSAFLSGDDLTLFLGQLNGLAKKGRTERLVFEMRVNPRGAAPFPVSVTLAPVRDAQGRIVGLRCLLRDIGERLRLLADLAAERARLQAIIQNAPQGIVVTDAADRVLLTNPAADRLSPPPVPYREPDETYAVMQLWYPDGTPCDPRDLPLTRSALDGETVTGVEMAILWPDGGRRELLVNSAPILDGEGRGGGAVALFQDITEQVRLREQSQRLEEQYRQAQKMEAIGQLTAGIAHNFNNLLTAINGFASILQSELSPDDPRQELAEKILESGWRGAELVRQLMAFSSMQVIQTQVLDLNSLVVALNRMFQHIIGEDIEQRIVLAPDLWPIQADPMQMEQVIANLVVNARDAMPHGGLLAIETANVVLDEAYAEAHLEAQPGDKVLLSVSDTGIGMSQEVKGHLFEPFFTTKEPDKGTGLGLATIHGIVRQLGGHIEVASEEGQGATFKIFLPRAKGAARPVDRQPRMTGAPSGKETILVVEDDEAIREFVRRALQGQGYTVLVARNGYQALRIVASHSGRVHLLLTDVVMPGMSGPMLAEQLALACPDLKVLFMSGYNDDMVMQHGVSELKRTLLQKPFRPTVLARKVRQVLDSQRDSGR